MVKSLNIAHAIFLFILTALWISAMALKIKYQIDRVIGDPWTYDESLRPSQQLDSAYVILYFLGTLEILVWSILAFLKAKTANESGRPQLLLLLLIALPLLLRSTYNMGDTIYEELLNRYGNKHLYLATEIIYNLTTLAIYTGIVAIGRHHATSTPLPAYNPNPYPGPSKPNMAVGVHDPPLYHQHTPYTQPHVNAYTTPPPFHPHQQPQHHQQQQLPYQLHHPYPNQPHYHQQQPYPLYQQHSPPPQQGRIYSPPPPPQQQQQQQQPAHPQHITPVSPSANTAVSAELPSPRGTPGTLPVVR
ncbi:MAG: hypothetical protein Q9200_006427 [Gallowayella weberi]